MSCTKIFSKASALLVTSSFLSLGFASSEVGGKDLIDGEPAGGSGLRSTIEDPPLTQPAVKRKKLRDQPPLKTSRITLPDFTIPDTGSLENYVMSSRSR